MRDIASQRSTTRLKADHCGVISVPVNQLDCGVCFVSWQIAKVSNIVCECATGRLKSDHRVMIAISMDELHGGMVVSLLYTVRGRRYVRDFTTPRLKPDDRIVCPISLGDHTCRQGTSTVIRWDRTRWSSAVVSRSYRLGTSRSSTETWLTRLEDIPEHLVCVGRSLSNRTVRRR